MEDNWYLLWNGTTWAVYNEATVPSLGAFSDYMYRAYSVERKKGTELMRKLMNVGDKLNKNKTIPTNDNGNIFPELSDLLN